MRRRAVVLSFPVCLVVAAGCGDGPTGSRSDAVQSPPSTGLTAAEAIPATSSIEPAPTTPKTASSSSTTSVSTSTSSTSTSSTSTSSTSTSTTPALPSFSDATALELFPFTSVVDLGVSAGRLRQGDGALFAVWPGRDTVYRIDPSTATISAEIDLPGEPNPDVGTFLGYFGGDLWAMNGDLDHLQRVDAATFVIEAEIEMPTPGPSGNYWIQAGEQPLVNGFGDDEVVHVIDPVTNTVATTHQIPRADGSLIAFDSIWVSNIERGTVSRIRVDSPEDVTVIEVGGTPGIVATTDDTVWVLDRRSASITPIDPATNRVGDPVVIMPGANSGSLGGFAESPTGSIIVTVETTGGPQMAGIAVIDVDTGRVCQAGLLPDGVFPGGIQTVDEAVYMLLVPRDNEPSQLARLDVRC